MRKILIIPSWYPSIYNPGLGTFFREQTELFNNEFEIRILSGIQKTKIKRWKKLYNSASFSFLKVVQIKGKPDYFISPPPVSGFEFECGVNLFKRSNYNIAITSYIKAYEEITAYWQPDIIHAFDTFIGGIVASRINKAHNIPYFITEHNYLQFKNRSFINRDFVEAIERSRRVLLVSEYQLRNLLMYGVQCNPHIVGNYVNDSVFTLNEVLSFKNEFNILFIGRYAYHKDFSTLIKTIIEYDKRSPDKNFCFTIIGDLAGQKENIRIQLSELIVSTNIRFVEFVDRKDIASIFHKANVFLSTSIAETFGVGICEALMCGIPVVSTNNGGFDEMYVPGVNGIKTNIGDFSALAEALIKIRMNEIMFDPIKIRDSVKFKFGTQGFKSKLQAIYNSING
jgi:glycosyltransferase involved in cell wall biosynthesis